MIYSFFAFNRFGTCIFHEDYSEGKRLRGEGVWTPSAKEQDKQKLTAGLVHSVRYFASALVKGGGGDTGEGFFAFQTSAYKCHYMETPTQYRFVLLTDPSVSLNETKPFLRHNYSNLFVSTVSKDPTFQHAKSCVITNPAFGDQLYKSLQQVCIFF